MLNVAITFDYELFFGENFGSYDDVLFEPSAKLLDLLDRHNTKATFFVDVLSVYMHEKYGLTDYRDRFVSQIQDMVRRGHDVQLHIHSNWLKSTYADGKWLFDIPSYRIHSFGFDKNNETSVQSMIKWGKDFLTKTLTVIKPDYKCIAYRAGGYCIQPHGELFRVLLENGIFVDSSVPLRQSSTGANSYDFTDCEQCVGWWVNPNEKLSTPHHFEENAVFELPIGAVKNSLLRRLFSPEEERVFTPKELRGTFIGLPHTATVAKHKNMLSRLLFYGKQYKMYTCDGVKATTLIRAIRKLTRAIGKKQACVSIIGHPKLIDSRWLDNFDTLLSSAQQVKNTGFVTVSEIARILTLTDN